MVLTLILIYGSINLGMYVSMFTRGRRQRGPKVIDLQPLLAKGLAKLNEWQKVPSCDLWKKIGGWMLVVLGYLGLGILAFILAVMGLAL